MTPPQLLGLPVEVAVEILSYLGCQDLLSCSAVCKSLRAVVKESLELRYIIELAADGMVDVPPVPMNTADRLALLLDRRRRWRELDWIEKIPVTMPGACQAYELVGGVFAKTMGGLHMGGSYHLNATWLPSRTQPARSLIREDLGVPTRDFAIDPSQDLIVIVSRDDSNPADFAIKLHLRTISTNAPHPLAKQAGFSVPISWIHSNCFIQIVDDVVGMFCWVHGPALFIWNWHHAELLISLAGLQLPLNVWDFGFLSNRAFMITSMHGPVKDGKGPHSFATHSGPYIHKPMPGKPFEADRTARVHLMALVYDDHGPRYHLFVHHRFLLSFIPAKGQSNAAPIERASDLDTMFASQIPWDAWGPANTRFIQHIHQFQWLRYVHGQRVALPPSLSTASVIPHCTLQVLDFNVHPQRVDDPVPIRPVGGNICPAGGTTGSYQLVTEPSKISSGLIFQNDVVTYLPYALLVRTGDFEYSGFMIDDERIVGMKAVVDPIPDLHSSVQLNHSLLLTPTNLRPSHLITMSSVNEALPNFLVSIPDVVATHVLGDSNAELGRGDLTLILTESAHVVAPSSPTRSSSCHAPVLTLTIGKAAFPLFKTTMFGTLADDMRAYVFVPEIGGEVGGRVVLVQILLVKILLPEGVTVVDSPFEKLQTKFEQALIHHGLLKEGIEAAADEIGMSMREESAKLAQRARGSTESHLSENPPTESPVEVHTAIHTASDSDANGAKSLASAARRMSIAVGTVAGQAGTWVTEHLVTTTTPASQTLNSLSNAHDSMADGYDAGSAEVGGALADAAGSRVENAYGTRAREVLDNTGSSAGNVGAAVGDVALATSGASLLTQGFKGAAGALPKQRDIKDTGKAAHANEDEDAWNDVSI
ncbi:hypothetical protein IEO21_03111 [Rhodonia placenta]|uniref:F-box domain-containing protein n=1 Tax=Rhodonia placenta TaxID=104341 RepID=A0A8H7P6T3_9APHY|nr:hypothetical protein IEO21_03111 [Postia placenta]